jgi:hypothetical protein
MTVAELIVELQKYDSGLPVWHEGCDCYGSASDVSLEEWALNEDGETKTRPVVVIGRDR